MPLGERITSVSRGPPTDTMVRWWPKNARVSRAVTGVRERSLRSPPPSHSSLHEQNRNSTFRGRRQIRHRNPAV